jgi:hypothetical protein
MTAAARSIWFRCHSAMHEANAMGLQYVAVRAVGIMAARAAAQLRWRRTASARRSTSSMSL